MKTCEIGKCKQFPLLTYAHFPDFPHKQVEVCERHWAKHCDEDDKFDLKVYFKKKWS